MVLFSEPEWFSFQTKTKFLLTFLTLQYTSGKASCFRAVLWILFVSEFSQQFTFFKLKGSNGTKSTPVGWYKLSLEWL